MILGSLPTGIGVPIFPVVGSMGRMVFGLVTEEAGIEAYSMAVDGTEISHEGLMARVWNGVRITPLLRSTTRRRSGYRHRFLADACNGWPVDSHRQLCIADEPCGLRVAVDADHR